MTEEEKGFFQETLTGVMAEHLRSIAPDPDRHNKEHDFIGVLMEREARRRDDRCINAYRGIA